MLSSAAVTVTVSVFSPATSSVSPSMTTVASASVVKATTLTKSVKAGRSTTEPSSTSTPLTLNEDKEVSLLYRTFRVISYSSTVSPSAAATVIKSLFSPGARSVSPTTSMLASGSVA